MHNNKHNINCIVRWSEKAIQKISSSQNFQGIPFLILIHLKVAIWLAIEIVVRTYQSKSFITITFLFQETRAWCGQSIGHVTSCSFLTMTSDIPKQKVTIKYIEVRLIKRSKTTHGLVRNKDDANVMLNLRIEESQAFIHSSIYLNRQDTMRPTFLVEFVRHPTFLVDFVRHPTFIVEFVRHPTFQVEFVRHPTFLVEFVRHPTFLVEFVRLLLNF